MPDLIRADAASLAQAATEWMIADFAAKPGCIAVSLSGGSTPKLLYQTMASGPYRNRLPWDRIHWFWGDERFVPPEDPRSNQSMVRAAMLDHAPVPPQNIHPIPTTGLTPQAAAAAYESALQAFQNVPLFDLVLLGLGTNGHTASLFPNDPVLQERTAWAAPVTPPGEPTRITLTWPPLENCRNAAFLVVGADKAQVVKEVKAGDQTHPATHYHPVGTLHWWMDNSAAGL